MHPSLARIKARIRDVTKPLGEAAVGGLTFGLLRGTRYFDPDKTADRFGRIAQLIGPALREQRIGRASQFFGVIFSGANGRFIDRCSSSDKGR